MDIRKQYLIQAVTVASNNLRLTSEKIETIVLLKRFLADTADLERAIAKMKKITALSKLGIKMGEIYNYIDGSSVDFLKLSEKFKEQSHNIIRQLNDFLEVTGAESLKVILAGIDEKEEDPEKDNEEQSEEKEEGEPDKKKDPADDKIKRTLEIVKKVNVLLDKYNRDEFTEEDIDLCILELYDLVSLVRSLNKDAGRMSRIASTALIMIRDDELKATKENIEYIRACLIVIVARVRGKEVDISDYSRLAEQFGDLIMKNDRGSD